MGHALNLFGHQIDLVALRYAVLIRHDFRDFLLNIEVCRKHFQFRQYGFHLFWRQLSVQFGHKFGCEIFMKKALLLGTQREGTVI